ncbi:hypothetical protein WG66_000601, partial [Moniliophthora roreri]
MLQHGPIGGRGRRTCNRYFQHEIANNLDWNHRLHLSRFRMLKQSIRGVVVRSLQRNPSLHHSRTTHPAEIHSFSAFQVTSFVSQPIY